MSAGGRPTSLTQEVRAKVLEALRVGLSRAAAAGRAGIGERTLREWLARSDDVEPYASFRAEVEAAEALCEARLSAVVFKAALEDPNQARWLLERRFPKQWGRRAVDKGDQAGEGKPGGFASKFLRPKPDVPFGFKRAEEGSNEEAPRPFWRRGPSTAEGEQPRRKPWEAPDDDPGGGKPS